MTTSYSVVDLFAGPGGLGEGFSALRGADGHPSFRIALSIEKDLSAFRTLRFRAFFRRATDRGIDVDWSALEPTRRDAEQVFLEAQSAAARSLWLEAESEVLCAELGSTQDRRTVKEAFSKVEGPTVLIGGPPCQAYSLAGRARNVGIEGYRPEDDQRHFLYREYVSSLDNLRPDAFVMENVKGILSAKVRRGGVFERIVSDLQDAGYLLFPLAPRRPLNGQTADPSSFVIRSEDFSVPQARHRVIIVGFRREVVERLGPEIASTLHRLIPQMFGASEPAVALESAIGDLPELRGLLSSRSKAFGSPSEAVSAQAQEIRAAEDLPRLLGESQLLRLLQILDEAVAANRRTPNGRGRRGSSARLPKGLRQWLTPRAEVGLHNHEPRRHMSSDLGRYLYAACYAKTTGRSPRATEFPEVLAPDHANWKSGKFVDRFRVQLADAPGTTVTSHISKDGHYFIHPDPTQCRSLTVREAARLQTFPDDYVFIGNRTQQYVQVGNAVPPFLALRIASVVRRVLEGNVACGEDAIFSADPRP